MTTIARIPSSRDPNVVYTVTREENVTTCTCPGFQFRNTCKHVKECDDGDEELVRRFLDDDAELIAILDSVK